MNARLLTTARFKTSAALPKKNGVATRKKKNAVTEIQRDGTMMKLTSIVVTLAVKVEHLKMDLPYLLRLSLGRCCSCES